MFFKGVNMESKIKKFFKSKSIAVVGASRDKAKYGYKVFHLLKSKGYTVYPVNNKIKELDGETVYSSIENIEEHIDAVSIIIPPAGADSIMEQIYSKGIKSVWFQPGAESYKLIRYCTAHKIEVIYHKCVLVEAY